MTTPKWARAGALLHALLEGRDIKIGGQTYRLSQTKDRIGRDVYDLGLLVLPEKDHSPQVLRTKSTLAEFIALAASMTEAEYDVVARILTASGGMGAAVPGPKPARRRITF
jgi:hypothetical protein